MPPPLPTAIELLAAREEGRAGASIELVLRELIGQPLRDLHRAVDMIVIGFGDDVRRAPLPPYEGNDPARRARQEQRDAEEMARHRLHLQCPFRLDAPWGPFLGGHDIYRSAEPPHERLYDGTWQTDNLFDRRAQDGGGVDGLTLVVDSVSADRGGGFVLELSQGWRITVAPATAAIEEHWRYFRIDDDDGHFVVFPEG